MICFASAGILMNALRLHGNDSEVFVDRESLRRVLQVLLPAALYVLAIQFIGIYVASALYITLFMVLLGKYPLAAFAVRRRGGQCVLLLHVRGLVQGAAVQGRAGPHPLPGLLTWAI